MTQSLLNHPNRFFPLSNAAPRDLLPSIPFIDVGHVKAKMKSLTKKYFPKYWRDHGHVDFVNILKRNGGIPCVECVGKGGGR